MKEDVKTGKFPMLVLWIWVGIASASSVWAENDDWNALLSAKEAFHEMQPATLEHDEFEKFLSEYNRAAGVLADRYRAFLRNNSEDPHSKQAWNDWMDFLDIAAHGSPERKAELEEAERTVLADPAADPGRRERIRNSQVDRTPDLAARERLIRKFKDEFRSPNDFFCFRMLELAEFTDHPHAQEIVDEVLRLTEPPSPEIAARLDQLREERKAAMEEKQKDQAWFERYKKIATELKALGENWRPMAAYYRAQALELKRRLDRVGKPLELHFTALDGTQLDLRDYRGKVVLLDFWATWCPPCVAGLTHVKPVRESFRDQGFEVIGISYDTDKAVLKRFLKTNGMDWPQFYDDAGKNSAAVQTLGAPGPPAYWLIDRKGILVDVAAFDKLEDKVKRLLSEESQAP